MIEVGEFLRANRSRVEGSRPLLGGVRGQKFNIAVGNLDAGKRTRQPGAVLKAAEEPGDLLPGRRPVGRFNQSALQGQLVIERRRPPGPGR